jgi:hypothetical protein
MSENYAEERWKGFWALFKWAFFKGDDNRKGGCSRVYSVNLRQHYAASGKHGEARRIIFG